MTTSILFVIVIDSFHLWHALEGQGLKGKPYARSEINDIQKAERRRVVDIRPMRKRLQTVRERAQASDNGGADRRDSEAFCESARAVIEPGLREEMELEERALKSEYAPVEDLFNKSFSHRVINLASVAWAQQDKPSASYQMQEKVGCEQLRIVAKKK